MTLKQHSEIETRFIAVIMLLIAILVMQIATMFMIDFAVDEIKESHERTIIVPPTQYIPPPRQLLSDC